MSVMNVNIVVADEYMGRFSQVLQRSKKVGLHVKDQMKEMGLIIGSIDSSKLDELKRVKGISAVEKDREINLAPPDSDIQ
jgi:hypothetical protein